MSEAISKFYIDLGVKYDETSLKKLNKGLKATFKSLKKIGMVGGAMAGVGIAWAGFATQISKSVVGIDILSKRVNMNRNELLTWQRSIKRVGGSAEEMNSIVKTFADARSQMIMGKDQEMVTKLGEVGLDYNMDFKSMVSQIRKNWKKYSPELRNYINNSLFGGSSAMYGLLDSTSKEYTNIKNSAKAVGGYTDADVKKNKELLSIVSEMSDRWEMFKRDLLIDSMPALKDTFTELRKMFEDADMKEVMGNMITFFTEQLPKMIKTLVIFANRLSEAMNSGSMMKGMGILFGGTKAEKEARKKTPENQATGLRETLQGKRGLFSTAMQAKAGYSAIKNFVPSLFGGGDKDGVTNTSSSAVQNNTFNIQGSNANEIGNSVKDKITPYGVVGKGNN